MGHSLKWGLSLVSVAGASASVGVPLGMKFNRGGQERLKNVSLTICEINNQVGLSEISFGEELDKNLCGKWADETKRVENSNVLEYTEFFKDNWEQKGQDGNGGPDRWWTAQCIGDEMNSQGALTNSDAKIGKGYLGLCDTALLDQTKFIKKEKKSEGDSVNNFFTFGTCDNNCGVAVGEVQKVKTLNTENKDSGKEVKFYVKQ